MGIKGLSIQSRVSIAPVGAESTLGTATASAGPDDLKLN